MGYHSDIQRKGGDNMKYAINTDTIPKGKPSAKQVQLNKWKYNEMVAMALIMPYDSNNENKENSIRLTQFESKREYTSSATKALQYLIKFQPVPEPLRTKLIKEAENIRKQGMESCFE